MTPLQERRLEARAIRERWPMTDEVREKVLKRLCRIASESESDREATAAARAIIAADSINLKAELLPTPEVRINEIDRALAFSAAIEAMNTDPDYVKYLEEKLLKEYEEQSKHDEEQSQHNLPA